MAEPQDEELSSRVQRLLREIEAQYRLLAKQRELAEELREEQAEERRKRHLAERNHPPTPGAPT